MTATIFADYQCGEPKVDFDKILQQATGGQIEISEGFVSPSAIRPLIFSDPGLVFLAIHGEDAGFQQDSGRYRLLPLLSKLGAEFEAAYLRHEAPHAVRLLENNRDVRKVEHFKKTLEHLNKGTKFLYQVPLWWWPSQIYGVADCVVHTSWLYKRYPHLKPTLPELPHYVIIDFKFSQKLDSTAKKQHLEHATTQVRLYSYILGQLQVYMPKRAFIISRDTIDSPIIVDVNMELDEALDDELVDLRDAYLDIKRDSTLRPWIDKKVELNPLNKSDEPWHDAKHQILTERVTPRSLLMLPGVGQEIARKMRLHGFKNIDDLLARNIDRLQLEKVDGINPAKANRIRAVLKANKTGMASDIPHNLVPRKADVELFIDMEYLSSLNCDFDTDWPHLVGKPQIFMIGCGFKKQGEWCFKRFTAEEESHEGEAKMLRSFLAFLRKMGVLDPDKTAALYHWSSAEVWQARQAALRHNLPQLEDLPFVDLCQVFTEGPIALPGAWNFGLKTVTEALSKYNPFYRLVWPEGLSSGQSAAVAGWAAYDQEEPLKTPEMRLIAQYLSQDVRALERILAWLRNSKKSENKKKANCWYRNTNTTQECTTSVRNSRGWYRSANPAA